MTTSHAGPAADSPGAVEADSGASRGSYRRLLGVAEFRALFAAQVVSVLGSVVAQLALAVLVYQRSQSPLLSALTFALGMVPYLVGGLLLTGIVDRLPARRTLVVCNVLSTALVGLMVLHLPVPAYLVLIFAAGLVEPVFAGVRTALLPRLVGAGADFVLGRSLLSMVWAGAQVLGYAAGALLLANLGPRGALALDAASFFGSALLVRVGLPALPPILDAGSAQIRDSLRHLKAILADRWVRALLLSHWLLPACALAPEALVAAYTRLIGQPDSHSGYLLGSVAAGMLVSNTVIGRCLSQRAQQIAIIPAVIVQGVALLGFLAPVGIGASVALMAVLGAASLISLGQSSLLIDALPETTRSRGLVIDSSGLMVVQGAGFALWGGLAQVAPLRLTIGIAGAATLAICAWFAAIWRVQQRSDHTAGVP